MKKRSKTVQEAIDRLYAQLANTCASKALSYVTSLHENHFAVADQYVTKAVEYMEKSSAEAVRWYCGNFKP